MGTPQKTLTIKNIESACNINVFILLALVTDLLTPFLIWKEILPNYVRLVSHAAVMVMIIFVYMRMMTLNHIPGIIWLIVGISVIGFFTALYNGQALLPTAWGWWMMFRYPFIGLFAFLSPRWPEQFSQRLINLCVIILTLVVIVQLGQYLTGERPGDNLAGLFGRYGTGDLIIFILLVLSMAFGRWLAKRQWRMLAVVLVLGGISSIFGGMKLFLFATFALAGLAIILYILRGKHLWKLVPYFFFLVMITFVFLISYNFIVPGAQNSPLEKYLENPQYLNTYLNIEIRRVGDGAYYYEIGRNYALVYGWNNLRRDYLSMILGWGLGARGESRTLDTVGLGLVQGNLGLTTGTSLLVIMQELGILGMITLVIFILWIIFTLRKRIRSYPQSTALELRYALLMFSALWPLWLWYNTAWTSRVPMLIYWTALGYSLSGASENGGLYFRQASTKDLVRSQRE